MGKPRTYVGPRLALFLLIAAGAALVWGGGAAFVIETLLANRGPRQVVEGIRIRADGEPLITQHAYRNRTYETLPDLTLDRNLAPASDLPTLSGAHFSRVRIHARQLHTVNGWVMRVLQVGDQRLDYLSNGSDVRWYAVRDASDEGHAYLAGYDLKSKLPIGYLGRGGFREEPPGVDEQFVVGALYGRAASVFWARDVGGPQVSYAYLLDEDRLVEIDTIDRSSRVVAELPGVEGINVVTTQVIADKSPGSEAAEDAPDGRPLVASSRVERRLVMRQEDRVAMIEPTGGGVVQFQLPEDVRDADWIQFYVVSPTTAVVVYPPHARDSRTQRVLWFTAAGEVTREETVVFAGPAQDERKEFIKVATIVPAPGVLMSLILMGAPNSPLHQEKSYFHAVFAVLAAGWPPLVALLAACGAMAWRVGHLHRRDGRPHAAFWTVFVFLLGWPGFLAYLAERRPVPSGTCPACGKRSSRNRVDCAACGQDAFRPRLLGTEVFA